MGEGAVSRVVTFPFLQNLGTYLPGENVMLLKHRLQCAVQTFKQMPQQQANLHISSLKSTKCVKYSKCKKTRNARKSEGDPLHINVGSV